jgi:hypothetical protein
MELINRNQKLSFSIIIFLNLIAILPMPYSYYQLLRIVNCALFALLAYRFSENKIGKMVIPSVFFAIIYNPFLKVGLGKEIWIFFNVLSALHLITSASILKRLKIEIL